jgi:hypothetical protein
MVRAGVYHSGLIVKSHYLCDQNQEKMSEILNVIRYTVPAVIVFITAYFLLKEFFHQETKKREADIRLEKVKIMLPVRMQAYERIILFLERISPTNLVMRVHQQGMSSAEFQKVLIQTIREEYTHNLSQQLYVSSKAWEMLKTAREEMIRQINTSAAQLDEKANSIDLSNKLLEMSMEKMATKKALDFLKEEARQNF